MLSTCKRQQSSALSGIETSTSKQEQVHLPPLSNLRDGNPVTLLSKISKNAGTPFRELHRVVHSPYLGWNFREQALLAANPSFCMARLNAKNAGSGDRRSEKVVSTERSDEEATYRVSSTRRDGSYRISSRCGQVH